jgi:hypothetical protein
MGFVIHDMLYKYLLTNNGSHHYKELHKQVVKTLILKGFKKKENGLLTRGGEEVLEERAVWVGPTLISRSVMKSGNLYIS